MIEDCLWKLRASALQVYTGNGNAPYGDHGPDHWDMVAMLGAVLASAEEECATTAEAFGYVHDCMRYGEDECYEHGPVAEQLLRKEKWLDALPITNENIARLLYAVSIHSDGCVSEADGLIGAMLDADRLDLGRVGVSVDRRFLSTSTAADLLNGDLIRNSSGFAVALWHGADSVFCRVKPAKIGGVSYFTETEEVAGFYGTPGRYLLSGRRFIDLTDPCAHVTNIAIMRALREVEKLCPQYSQVSGEKFNLLSTLEAGAVYQELGRTTSDAVYSKIMRLCDADALRVFDDSGSHGSVATWVAMNKTNCILC